MNEKMKGHPCEKNDEKSGGSPMGCVGCVRVGGGAGYVEAMKAPSGEGRAQPIEEPPCGSGLELEQAKFAYRLALNQARRAVVRDKRRHWQEAAQKLEQLFKQGNLHQAYKEVKIRAEPHAKDNKIPEQMRRGDGELVVGKRENAEMKKEYFAELLNVSRDASPDLSSVPSAGMASSVNIDPPTLEETVDAIEQLKNHKAAGVCSILAESLKYGGMGIKQWLHKIIVETWTSGQAPSDWKSALIVPVFKSGDVTLLDNFRGISLFKHLRKSVRHPCWQQVENVG